jgi:hypothetical protein
MGSFGSCGQVSLQLLLGSSAVPMQKRSTSSDEDLHDLEDLLARPLLELRSSYSSLQLLLGSSTVPLQLLGTSSGDDLSKQLANSDDTQ